MTRSRTSVLLALLLAAPAAGQFAPSEYPDAILERDDPEAARIFLGVPGLQSDFKAKDPDLYARMFARAAELKDLADLLEGAQNGSADQLRMGLLQRPGCAFCQKPAEMEAWVAKHVDAKLAPVGRLRETFWDWPLLAPAQRQWLAAHGAAEGDWGNLTLVERRARLRGWAADEKTAIMALDARTPDEADAMQNRAYLYVQVVGSLEAAAVWDRVNQARAAVDGLARARAEFRRTKDPQLRQALRDAQNATDPEARLAALSRLYDNSGRHDAVLASVAPPKPGQAFDDRSRRTVAALLASGLLRETDGTWAGRELKDFYATRPMNVVVAPAPSAWLAWYQGDKLTFNEKFIAEYVKARGRTLDDLAKDPALLKPLLQEVAPIFVHEATHHRQDAWAKSQDIPFWGGEAAEEEAMMTESLFVLQKQRIDPSYKKFLQERQSTSTNAREALALSRRLQKDRADWFGESVMATHYPEYLSMTGTAWCQILWHNDVAGEVQREIERRRSLAPDEQAALAGARDFGQYQSREDFMKELGSVGTPHLQAFIDGQKQEIARQPEIYAKYVARLEDAKRRTDERLGLLESAPARPRDAVPPPDIGRR